MLLEPFSLDWQRVVLQPCLRHDAWWKYWEIVLDRIFYKRTWLEMSYFFSFCLFFSFFFSFLFFSFLFFFLCMIKCDSFFLVLITWHTYIHMYIHWSFFFFGQRTRTTYNNTSTHLIPYSFQPKTTPLPRTRIHTYIYIYSIIFFYISY